MGDTAETLRSIDAQSDLALSGLAAVSDQHAQLVSELVDRLVSHPDLAHNAASPDDVAPAVLVAAFDHTVERLLAEHKTLVGNIRRQISRLARQDTPPEQVKAWRTAVTKHG